MKDTVLSVAAAGPLVSIQDGGRRGMMRFGVPASGPMDRLAFAAANLALGNAPDAPGIEVSMGGLALDCLSGTVTFAVAGGGFLIEVGGRKLGSWSVETLRAGERLVIRPGPWGSWTYLAFAGRLAAENWLGSSATHSLSGLGGGRIMAGQRLIMSCDGPHKRRWGAIPCPVAARPRADLRVVLGPQDRFFGTETLAMFLGEPFRVTTAYDRMGARLSGPDLTPRTSLDMPSEAILRGSVQVAGDGVATVLLADHQTTGGYPKIATVVSPDLDAFVQLRPHDECRFRSVTPQEAVAIARTRHAMLGRYFTRLADPGAHVGTQVRIM